MGFVHVDSHCRLACNYCARLGFLKESPVPTGQKVFPCNSIFSSNTPAYLEADSEGKRILLHCSTKRADAVAFLNQVREKKELRFTVLIDRPGAYYENWLEIFSQFKLQPDFVLLPRRSIGLANLIAWLPPSLYARTSLFFPSVKDEDFYLPAEACFALEELRDRYPSFIPRPWDDGGESYLHTLAESQLHKEIGATKISRLRKFFPLRILTNFVAALLLLFLEPWRFANIAMAIYGVLERRSIAVYWSLYQGTAELLGKLNFLRGWILGKLLLRIFYFFYAIQGWIFGKILVRVYYRFVALGHWLHRISLPILYGAIGSLYFGAGWVFGKIFLRGIHFSHRNLVRGYWGLFHYQQEMRGVLRKYSVLAYWQMYRIYRYFCDTLWLYSYPLRKIYYFSEYQLGKRVL